MLRSTLTKFVAASGLVNLADGIAMVAWAWLASLLTRDPLLIAIVLVVLRLPWVLFTIPAGIITDRMDRRKLILTMDVLRSGALALCARGRVNGTVCDRNGWEYRLGGIWLACLGAPLALEKCVPQ